MRAIVAGGTGGIGRAVCLALASAGSDVEFTFRANAAAAEALVGEIGALGRRAAATALSLEDAGATAAFVAAAAGRLGGVDRLVYAAGPRLEMRRVAEVSADEWARVVDGDVKGAFHLFAAALPHLRASGGALVAVTTAAVLRTPSGDLLSAAPKAAVELLVRSIAKEEGVHGVRANCVAPGWIDGGLGQALMAQMGLDYVERVKRSLPLRRLGSLDDVAEAVTYLLEARNVTGQTLAVDGGAHI